MGLGAIYILDYPRLRWISIGMGVIFVGIAAFVHMTGDLSGGARFLPLIPLATGVALIGAGSFLNLHAMRLFYIIWFIALPAAFWLVNTVGCELKLFADSWCQ